MQLRKTDALAPLLEAVAERDAAALETLYERTHRWAFGLAWRIVGREDLAEDVVLEAYQQVWERGASFDRERGTGAAWLATLIRRRALDAGRREETRRRHETASVEKESESGPEPESPGDQMEREEHIRSALDTLPHEQQRAIELAFFEGLCHREIAERLPAAIGTVKTRIRLGMMKLRSVLQKYREEL
ncbi:MAG: sigma-70 family RNA polymerase sigma factor [Planctomycetota bacterium]